jgi:hypothetical protein
MWCCSSSERRGGEWGWVWRGPGEGLNIYRGRREAEAPGRLQWLAMKAMVTHCEEGAGIYDQVKACDRVKEGASVGVAPWRERRATRWPWLSGARGRGGGATGSGE